jgi:hypothetical protein
MFEPQMRGVRMFPLVRPDDFGQALKAAGLSVKPRNEDLETAVAAASQFAWDIVMTQLEPSTSGMRRMARELGAVAQAASKLRHLITERLEAPHQQAPDSRTELIRRLSASQDPVYLNLLSYVGADAGSAHGATLLADRILLLDELTGWYQATSDAVTAGVTREQRSRTSPGMRSRPREFGWVLVASYVLLTGKTPRISRTGTGLSEGKLGGPLIRFLGHMFSCVRRTLMASPELGALAKGKVWRPSDEALRTWVISFRTRLQSMQAER